MGCHPTVTRDNWSVSTTTGTGIDGAILSVCKMFVRPVRPEEKRTPEHMVTTKFRRGDHDKRRFDTVEEATAFALDRGYLRRYSRNWRGRLFKEEK